MAATSQAWREIEPHLSCVLPLAWEYRHLGVPLEDLQAEGTLGLLEAAARYDPTRGVRFFSYAAWWIRKCIVEAISRQSMLVRVPRGPIRRLRIVREVERELSARLGRAPTTEESARGAGLREREVERALLTTRRVVSLHDPVGRDGNRTLEEVLADPREGRVDESLSRASGVVRLQALLDRLPARQRTVLVLRFGLDGHPEQTLQAIGTRLGVTRERVRQLEQKGLEQLRRGVVPGRPASHGQ
jgi:RNA polymerase sigma factor (sigma-70 family)